MGDEAKSKLVYGTVIVAFEVEDVTYFTTEQQDFIASTPVPRVGTPQ